jgi:hypothetical protein
MMLRPISPSFRLIDGVVRKWMGVQPAPMRQNFAATARSGAPDTPRETERLDPTDTGVMATRLLAPRVSEEEKGEYQRFVNSLARAAALFAHE